MSEACCIFHDNGGAASMLCSGALPQARSVPIPRAPREPRDLDRGTLLRVLQAKAECAVADLRWITEHGARGIGDDRGEWRMWVEMAAQLDYLTRRVVAYAADARR